MPRQVRPWFRFYVEAFGDRKMLRLTPAQRWVWVAVLGAARESPVPGRLYIADGVPMTTSELARFADVRDRDATSALDTMTQLGMVSVQDGVVVVKNWGARQFESDDVTARTRGHRERSNTTPKERRRNVPTNGGGNDVGTHQRQRQKTEAELTPPTTSGPPTTTARGTRLPDAFAVTEPMRAWADQHAPNAGARDHDAFCDYWQAKPGADGRKADWAATWRNWMRKASDERGAVATRRPTPMDRAREVADIGARMQARADAQHDRLAIGGTP